MSWKLLILAATLGLAACGDGANDLASSLSDDSFSSVCEDCDDMSSSSKKMGSAVSSSSVTSFGNGSRGNESSSSVQSSSSLPLAIPCKDSTRDDCEYGSIIDKRDGQIYKTVKIGSQWWMAENLNFETEGSYCYNDLEGNCSAYGKLFRRSAAMDSAGVYSTNAKGCRVGVKCDLVYPVRGACPVGWHLPDSTEWSILFTAVGGESKAGVMLKSDRGWDQYKGTNGIDAFGFSARAAGYRYTAQSYDYMWRAAYFWSVAGNSGYYVKLEYSHKESFFKQMSFSDWGYSIRCVKNDTLVSSDIPEKSLPVVPSESVDSLTDERDGQIYKTVTIGNQVWMAENLKYRGDNVKPACYNDADSNCVKYGALYTWPTAMDFAGIWSDNGKGCNFGKKCTPTYPVRGICPAGWHLPEYSEWHTLFDAVGGVLAAETNLKSTSGWNDDGNGTDVYGFLAMPVGYYSLGQSYKLGEIAWFWSSSQLNENYAYKMVLDYRYKYVHVRDNETKYSALPVRCVKD